MDLMISTERTQQCCRESKESSVRHSFVIGTLLPRDFANLEADKLASKVTHVNIIIQTSLGGNMIEIYQCQISGWYTLFRG